jgi:hypothetical protein
VEAMMEIGEPFEVVEEAISACALADDAEAALWLFAWSLAERGTKLPRRRHLHVVPA